jgi:glyceraldehyde-3-phosphate dehydrogenase/erythrose-4-phosphate dehydrogenase
LSEKWLELTSRKFKELEPVFEQILNQENTGFNVWAGDGELTMVIDKNLVKVVAWYYNKMGFSNRMVDVFGLITAS